MPTKYKDSPIAYFCAEFGIDNDLPTYSGGLGVLAGDIMNAAADQDLPFIGIGILYKGKNFLQYITKEGKESQRDSEFDHDTSFLRPTTKNGKPLLIKLDMFGSEVIIKSYHVRLADNTTLYFLSTNVDGNPPEWIADVNALYHGDTNSQIRQQIILGVGGARLLKELGIKPKLYHINEGRPCFVIWELVSEFMLENKIPFEEAWKKAKEKIVYTNHTLVAAGNLTYPSETVERWAAPFSKKLGIDTNLLIKDGFINPGTFSITLFALNISSKQSAVSQVHGEYAIKEWPGFNFISITNGVHLPRWQDSDFRKSNLTPQEIWDLHMIKKRELVDTVIKRTGFGYDPERMVISWARRLAEYKQPKIIFEDVERLNSIIRNQSMPVQILFAGNSHSADTNAGSIIKDIIELFSSELIGHAIFIPNYNISLANHLASGSDVWLNTPKGNLEASGTSGMKAMSNGVLNCTVLDGWTNEVDWKGKGWVLDPENVSSSFYSLLENEIVPLYFKKDINGLPMEWIERMRSSIALVEKFSAKRVIQEYQDKLYST